MWIFGGVIVGRVRVYMEILRWVYVYFWVYVDIVLL